VSPLHDDPSVLMFDHCEPCLRGKGRRRATWVGESTAHGSTRRAVTKEFDVGQGPAVVDDTHARKSAPDTTTGTVLTLDTALLPEGWGHWRPGRRQVELPVDQRPTLGAGIGQKHPDGRPRPRRSLTRTPGNGGRTGTALADCAAQHVMPEVPAVGVVTVVVGGAYLVWILIHEQRRRLARP
jgi:hypothetical protein